MEGCQTVLYHRKGYPWSDILVISVSIAYSRLTSSKMGADETDWSRMQHETNGNSSFITSITTHSSFHRLHSHVPEISSKFSRFSKFSIFAIGMHDFPKQRSCFVSQSSKTAEGSLAFRTRNRDSCSPLRHIKIRTWSSIYRSMVSRSVKESLQGVRGK